MNIKTNNRLEGAADNSNTRVYSCRKNPGISDERKTILIFGLGELQRTLIHECNKLGLYTIGIDVTENAICKSDVDEFEVVAGDDYQTTLELAKKHAVSGVVTAATDKPLVMMARVAKALKMPFFSIKTAQWSTDKFLMKERFRRFGISCANGMELMTPDDLEKVRWEYPIIIKPKDNSGSRGVICCNNRESTIKSINEAFEYTRMESILAEEYIEGQEYSIESLHYRGKTYVIQFTEKITTEFPYNVELGHIQPAKLSEENKEKIREIIAKIAKAMDFDNCASHTELKVNKKGIYVIETSPRLGGDYITSRLTPLSTGINMEQLLIRMSIGESIPEKEFTSRQERSSGIVFFELREGCIGDIGALSELENIEGACEYQFNRNTGDKIGKIKNSLDRYGFEIFQTESYGNTIKSMTEAKQLINEIVRVK